MLDDDGGGDLRGDDIDIRRIPFSDSWPMVRMNL